MEKLKAVGRIVFGFVLILGVPIGIFVLAKGSGWAAEHVLPALFVLGALVLFLDLFLLVASVVKPVRLVAGPTLYASSYLFGGILWLSGLVYTYALWGMVGVLVGFLVLGIGVVPIGMMATLLHGQWEPFFSLVLLTVITFGFRIAGVALLASTGAK